MKMNRALAKFLAAKKRPKNTLNYSSLHGFLFTISSSPEFIDLPQWLPMVFNEQPAKYKNTDQQALITNQLRTVYLEIDAQVEQGTYVLPEYLSASDNIKENFQDDAPISHWSRGFLIADDWLENLWQAYLPEQMKNDYQSCVNTLGFFANRKRAQEYCLSQFGEDVSMETVAESKLETFDLALESYAHMGRKIRQALQQAAGN